MIDQRILDLIVEASDDKEATMAVLKEAEQLSRICRQNNIQRDCPVCCICFSICRQMEIKDGKPL